MRVAWLKPTSDASSSTASSLSRKWASAPRASTKRWPRMLSLMSSVSDRLTGTRAFVNWVIGCFTPSSSMLKSFCSRLVTSRPSLSRTVTAVVTNSESLRKLFLSRRSIGLCPSTRSRGPSAPGRSLRTSALSATRMARLFRKVVERAAGTNEQLAVRRHRRREHLVVERVDLQHFPVALGVDHGHGAVLADEPDLAVGADRRGEVLVDGALQAALLDHVAGGGIE